MPVPSFTDQLETAMSQLPASGQWVEFNEYKGQLYLKNPQGGQAVFAHMIKADLVLKKLDVDTNGKPIVLLSRKS